MNRKNDRELNNVWKQVFEDNDKENQLYKILNVRPYYLYRAQENAEYGQVKNYHLLGGNTTAITSINFAIMMGAKNVVLIGIDNDAQNNTYFYESSNHYGGCFCTDEIKLKVNELARYSTILKANPNANFDIGFINIDELLS